MPPLVRKQAHNLYNICLTQRLHTTDGGSRLFASDSTEVCTCRLQTDVMLQDKYTDMYFQRALTTGLLVCTQCLDLKPAA